MFGGLWLDFLSCFVGFYEEIFGWLVGLGSLLLYLILEILNLIFTSNLSQSN